MYEVRNQKAITGVEFKENELVTKHNTLNAAKTLAETLHKEYKYNHFGVFKVEQVWTTQTLDEAIKS